MDKFADRLRDLRIEKGLSQRELAKVINISASAIQQWESKRREPIARYVVLLSRFFGVTTDYLLGEKDQ